MKHKNIKHIIDLVKIKPYVDVASSIHLQIKQRLYSIKNFLKTKNVSNFSIVYFGGTPVDEKMLEWKMLTFFTSPKIHNQTHFTMPKFIFK